MKSTAAVAPKGTLGSTQRWHPVQAGRRRWVGERYYGAAYYYSDYAADPDAVLGNWPVSPPVPAADPPPHRVVQFPVTIFYEYHPHWTVNPF